MGNEEPSRDDTAEQEARDVEHKEKADQLLESHWQEKVFTHEPGTLLGALGAYLIFVGTLTAIGALAATNNHKTTSEIFLLSSALLVLIVPVGVIWYFLRVRTLAKPANKDERGKGLLERIMQTPIISFLARLTNKPLARFLNLLLSIFWIAYWIFQFPLQPRLSLSMIVLNTSVFVMGITNEILRSYDRALQKQIKDIWEFNKLVQSILPSLHRASEQHETTINELREHHVALMDAHIKSADLTVAALKQTNKAIGVIAKTQGLEVPNGKDKEPNDQR